jgi:hypothetical protein
MVNVERFVSWGLVAGLASVVVVQQVELHSVVIKVNPVAPAIKALDRDLFNWIRSQELALAQARAAEQAATREDLKRLPSENFRSGPQPWGRE